MQDAATAPALSAHALEITLALSLAATLAAAAALATGRVARRLLNVVGREELASQPLARRTLRIARVLTFLMVFVVLAFPALDLAGFSPGVGLDSADLGHWAARTGVRIVALFLLAFVVVRVITIVISRAEMDMSVGTGLIRTRRPASRNGGTGKAGWAADGTRRMAFAALRSNSGPL